MTDVLTQGAVLDGADPHYLHSDDELMRRWMRAALERIKRIGPLGVDTYPECYRRMHAIAEEELSDEPTSASETFDGWQPIETAPKDGRTLLLGYFNSHGKWRSLHGQWFEQAEMDEWTSDDDGNPAGWYEISVENDDPPNCWATEPTHWQPTPKPPSKADGDPT